MIQKAHVFLLTLVCLMSLMTAEIYADGCAGVNLKGTRNYSVGQTPYDVVPGDFNLDGKPDIAVADYSVSSVRVAFGDGSGSFASVNTFAVGLNPTSLAVGDFNGDGKPDLVTANNGTVYVTVLLNNGTGGFSAAADYSAGGTPEKVLAADFNGDGKSDVAVTSLVGNFITILINNGTGGLLSPVYYPSTGSRPRDIVASDFNNDGKVDLATANGLNGATVSILLGTGTGTFNGLAAFQIFGLPFLSSLAAGDYNGDGKNDLVVASDNGTAANVRGLLGNGNGTFTAGAIIANSIALPSDVVLDYVNSDNKLDVVVLHDDLWRGWAANIYYGDGAGGTTLSQVVLMGGSAHSVVVADLNGDSQKDLVTDFVTGSDAGLSVALTNGTERIETADKISDGPYDSGTLLLADLNQDGRNDLAVSGGPLFGTYLYVFLNLANGGFEFTSFYAGAGGRYLASGDFNSDGSPDIAALTNYGDLTVTLNNGSGRFPSPAHFAVFGTADALATGDVNRDGKLDIIVASRSTNAIRIFTGNGSGGFQLTGNIYVNANPVSMVMGDFNGDGKPDVVTANVCDGTGCPARLLTLFAGDGLGSFAPPLDITTQVSPTPVLNNQSLAAGDFNGDGRLDLTITKIAAPDSPPQITFNQGGGSFSAFTGLPTTKPSQVITVGDVNGDGKPDIVTGGGGANGGDGDVQVFLNGGASGFDVPVTYAGLPYMQTILVGDTNADGKREIVFNNREPASSNSTTLWRLFNKCALNRSAGMTADFDGDGLTDLSVFRPSNGYWYIIYSSNSSFHAFAFGTNGDTPVPGDYDGDGKTDLAVFRPSTGTWYYLKSSDGQVAYQTFGANGDMPVQGDYDGDGRTNFAIWRPSTGTWYTSLDPATNFGAVVWGASTDTPVPADYDGDGRTDIGVFRPADAFWYLLKSSQGYQGQLFGASTDTPVPADYDGDGKEDLAVFRQSTGVWYTSLNPATNSGAIQFGQTGDVPVPGYYDGDGKADAAVFRQGDWYIFQSTNNSVRGVHFGSSGDVPAPQAP
ncbi:MAG: VCBS repeat-containing protein [Acidobacteria bacterium]|nr:VCBS repeat-containing protein [Acidobacteriota bacterium]